MPVAARARRDVREQVGPAGREPLELLDEIEQRIGLRPTPVNWPVGIAGDFRGLIERATGEYTAYTRRPGGAQKALEEHFKDPDEARAREGAAYEAAEEELALLDEIGADVDMPSFLAGESSPVLFGAALPNFGVRRLLDAMCELAPAPKPRADVDGTSAPVEAPFSGLVFKVQANMDPAHRDRVAFVRVCSGRFERGMVLTHAATGRPFATKYAQAMFGQERETVETAFPGDVIGLVNATALRPGDTLYADVPVHVPADPVVRARALRRRAVQGRREVQAVPAGHRPARHRGRGAGALLGPARRPGAGARRRRAAAVRRGAAPA